MKLMKLAKQIIEDILPPRLVGGPMPAAKKAVYNRLQALVDAIEPCVRDLKTEVAMLEEVLAHTYRPTQDESLSWYKHCEQINACGGNPPIESDHWVDVAISHWECQREST